ncbi:MAG: glycosyltransferase family 2 protein [Streptosporangiaceae bacterium]
MRIGNCVPDLAVIIPARNEASRLGGCLGSVREALECAEVTEAEVIVVDDNSTDETSDVARAHGVLAIRQSRRLGQMAACSLSVASSSASLLFFVDADCRVDKEAFSALLRGFARPAVGVVAARSEPDNGRTVSLVERSAIFSAVMLHETKSRLVNHDFLPIGRPFGLRRDAWQAGDDQRWPCDRIYASRAKHAGWEIIYMPEAVVYYQPVGAYDELRSAYLRSALTHSRARLATNWAEPLPRGVVSRAASASFRRQTLNAAAWLALRARLWSERSVGLARPDKEFASSGVWDKLPQDPSPSRPGPSHHNTPEEPAGRPA